MGTFGLSIVKKLGNGNVVKGYSSFAVVIAVTFIISAIITCLNVKERVETPKNAEKVSFKQTLNIIRKNDQLVVFLLYQQMLDILRIGFPYLQHM